MPYKNSRYKHKRQFSPDKCTPGTFRTVKQSHTKMRKPRKGGKAIVCKLKRSGRWGTQSLLNLKRNES